VRIMYVEECQRRKSNTPRCHMYVEECWRRKSNTPRCHAVCMWRSVGDVRVILQDVRLFKHVILFIINIIFLEKYTRIINKFLM
jgi:hypothetical protein